MTETTPRGVPTSALDLIDSATGKPFSHDRSQVDPEQAKPAGNGKAAKRRPLVSPELAAEAEKILHAIPGEPGPTHSRPEIRTLTMAQVPMQPVTWLVRPYFPMGMVTFIHGDPG
jgi:hypothetical protein